MPLNIKSKFGSDIDVGLVSEQPEFALQVSDGSTLTAQLRLFIGEAPENVVAPVIAGDTTLGATLTRTEGTWTGDPTPAVSGQWQRDGVAIAGETGETYAITLDDNGADITYLEAAVNAVATVTAASNAITVDTFTAPSAFGVSGWDVANDDDTISVNVLTLPASGGSPITDLEYRVNEGAAISLGETTTGSYVITADEGDDIQIRAVNAIGAGDWSDVKVVPAAFTGVQASGGIETVINPDEGEFYRVHTFLEDGDLTVTQGGEVEYLVVAGGGGGGNNWGGGGGGGGAGEVFKYVAGEAGNTGATPLLIPSVVVPVSVGLGGAGGVAPSSHSPGLIGQNSAISNIITALGGGFGDSGPLDGGDGGSGGGAGGAGAPRSGGSATGSGLGNDGGDVPGMASTERAGAGGGGANSVGGNSTVLQGGNGGAGIATDISGSALSIAGGGAGGSNRGSPGTSSDGGGGHTSGNDTGQPGTSNTGGGGAGAGNGQNTSTGVAGGNGGSGIVIIRYPITEAEYDAEAA